MELRAVWEFADRNWPVIDKVFTGIGQVLRPARASSRIFVPVKPSANS
jgi:hypothetical protein